MSDSLRYGLVAFVVFLTHFQDGITGFGSAALALPFLAILIGLNVSVPALIILGWLLSIFIILQSRQHIVWREYAKIMILAAIGMPVGVWLSGYLPENQMKWILAVVMVLIGTHGFIRQFAKSKQHGPISERKKRWLSGFVTLGGIMQGAFGTGGPLIVIYATRVYRDKGVFRCTLCLLWATLNPILIATRWAAGHKIDAAVLKVVAICLPSMFLGLVLGSIAHHRADEVTFRRIVYAVLILSGFMLVWTLLGI